jgi:hypothetical protein
MTIRVGQEKQESFPNSPVETTSANDIRTCMLASSRCFLHCALRGSPREALDPPYLVKMLAWQN